MKIRSRVKPGNFANHKLHLSFDWSPKGQNAEGSTFQLVNHYLTYVFLFAENSMLICYNSTAQEMRTILQQFDQDIQNTYKDLKLRHKRELRNLLLLEKSKNAVP